MVTIKLIDDGFDRYTLVSDSYVLGRMYDHCAEEIIIEKPEVEQNSVCTMIVKTIDGEILDYIAVGNAPISPTNFLSQNKVVQLGFSFERQDHSVKNSEYKRFEFLKAFEPYGNVPVSPEQEQNINFLISKGFVNAEYEDNKLKFENINGDIVDEVEIDTDLLDYYTKTEVDEKNSETLAESKEYTDTKVEEIKNNPDVVDIVQTKADLLAYDTSTLGNNDIVRVLVDETQDNKSSFYQWKVLTQEWILKGTVATGINLENGEGQFSLVQKVAPSTDPSLHPENEATGKEAVSLGRYNITDGDRAMTVNYDNKNYGKWSFVANTKNKNGSEGINQELVQSNTMLGSSNEIKVGMEGVVSGKGNTNYEGNRFNISGSENENYTNNVRMSGWKNKSLKEIKSVISTGGGGGTNPDTNPTNPDGSYDYTSNTGYADISGTQNEVFAMGGRTRGVAGKCYSPYGSTEGFWTKAGYLVEDTTKSTETEKYYKPQGLGAKAFGRATHAKEDFTLAGGDHSEALKKGSNSIGYYTKANTEWGTAIGKFNVGYENSLLEIGAGTSTSNRKNALTVYEDGRIVNINGGELLAGAKIGWAHEGSADAGKLMVLDSTGNFLVTNAPTLASHLTNKEYVDNKLLLITTTETQVGGIDGQHCPNLTVTQLQQIYLAYNAGKKVRIMTVSDARRYYDVISAEEEYCCIIAHDGSPIEYYNFDGIYIVPHSTIVNKDLSSPDFRPSANNYYRHNGESTSTFKNGVIYFYSNGSFKAIDGSGSGGDMTLKVHTTGTMQTSTLPAITVPTLTEQQISNITTAISQGKYVVIDNDYGQFAVSESDSDINGIRFTYYGYYLDYYVDGSTVTATYIKLDTELKNVATSQASLTIEDGKIFRYNTITTLSLNAPTSYAIDFMCAIYFTTGATISMDYSSILAKWTGDDVSSGVFVPKANKQYQIVFFNSGNNGTAKIQAVVRGVSND